jgi:hypothetical protein
LISGVAPPTPETSDSGVSALDRDWVADAARLIEADFNRSADTHLIRLELPRLAAAGSDLYLKDESTHPSGSLKHRWRDRSFFMACATAGSSAASRWLNPHPARPQSRKPISLGCSACLWSPSLRA